MKIIHLSDLHLGKSLHETNLYEDEEYILNEIIKIIDDKNIKLVMIAGDVYDKQIPTIGAVNLLNNFLEKLVERNIKVLIISGNHDSNERLGFGSNLLKNNNIYIETTFNGKLRKEKIDDVNYYMLPFVKPSNVKKYYDDVNNYNDAIKKVIDEAKIDNNEKNIILTHQFITSGNINPELSDSEDLNLGGIDNVDISNYKDFNYVAMGHIHRPQKLLKDTNRYSGSILKYSFSEANYNKSVPVIDTNTFDVELVPLIPIRDVRVIKGKMDELYNKELASDDYIKAVLTDEEAIYDPVGRLRNIYPNILSLEIENRRSLIDPNSKTSPSGDIREKSPLDLFEEFYLNQNNITLDDKRRTIIEEIIKEAKDETN